MEPSASAEELRLRQLPRLILFATGALLLAGLAAGAASWRTGDNTWVRAFFAYPGALFFVGCGSLQAWLSIRCWRQFSPGDLLRPAWFLIALSAISQLGAGVLSQILGSASALNPLFWLPGPIGGQLTRDAAIAGQRFGPLYMAFLACGLLYVITACRHNGILAPLKTVDLLLVGLVVLYTAYFFATVVFSPAHGGRSVDLAAVISWSSDPLLCILLFQAILIRRSTASLGFGLISRCWLAFAAAIFLTSVGDIGLWAWARGFLPYGLVMASWYVWFLPSAAYALGPLWQLQAMLRATRGEIRVEASAEQTIA